MSSFTIIQNKLEKFIRKFYTNELIKGSILFFAIGLLYFLITLLIEYFLWLDPLGRTILFWLFIFVEATLFIRFIAYPLLKLFNLQDGISKEEASRIIGSHFNEVNDKLLNVIQLNQNQKVSELLIASIEQKSIELKPVPFKRAVDYKRNLKYLKFAAIPVLIYLLFSFLGEKDLFTSSYTRVVNYETAYEPPAPFSFMVMNSSLKAIENKNYTLKIKTEGEIFPENAYIDYNNETYYLKQLSPGFFEHTLTSVQNDIKFVLKANKVTSKEYTISVLNTPSILSFEMKLDYPAYTGKEDVIIKNTGNSTIPEGTQVTWVLNTKNTKEVALHSKDSVILINFKGNEFKYSKRIFSRFDYAITTSNDELKNYENISFNLGVIKDEYPEIDIQSKKDSTNTQLVYFLGRISDDYGLTNLQLVYYPSDEKEKISIKRIPINSTTFEQFIYSFPNDLPLVDGVSYEYYFEVFDNDALHNFKSSKSAIYTFRKHTENENEKEQLQNQQNNIKGLDKTLKKLKDQEKTLEELSRLQKEKNELNWNDKKKLEDFIKRQRQQEEMMKNFSKELKENLENFQPEDEENDVFKEQLMERLEEKEEQLKENEKLLEELEKLKDKIQKEELTEKLEKLAKKNKNQEKSLEQLLELTKRYYVAKKAEKLIEELNKLAEEQEKLSEAPEEENTIEKQEELNKKFEDFIREMKDLQKENDALKEPMDIPSDKKGEEQVKEEQQEATENLKEQKKQEASKNQNKAAQKMKQMGQQMQSQMQSGQMETIEEDMEMLRQILDNLVVFSFEQEDLMGEFKAIDYGNPVFGKKLNTQNDLKKNFQHVDDSLFALSLRQPLLSGKINENLVEIEYNIDKSLERLAENRLHQGMASQQYTITGANELAGMLSDLLGNMQSQLSQAMGSGKGGQGQGMGKGEGKGFQLPDIIKKQESLNEKMEEGLEKGKNGEGNSEGKGKGEGEGENNGGEGNNGKDGKNRMEGNEGKQEGENNSNSEDMNGELYEIYKQQQQLRQLLQDKLNNSGLKGKTGNLLRQMKDIENQLLDKGFNQRTLQKMLRLKYELLKLDEADFEQGKETRRESRANRKNFNNSLRTDPELIKQYFNTTEILNREALPLKHDYKQRVQHYFRKKND
jgi:hypothetical protein